MPDSPSITVDLSNCDREPIHLTGAVQPFGFLIAVNRIDWTILRTSQNTATWLGHAPASLLGKPLDAVFSGEAIHTIRSHLQSAVMGDTVARAFGIDLTTRGPRCDVAVHIIGDTVVIECEPSVDEPELNAGATVRGMIARLQQTGDQRAFFRVAAREMRALTGFDRVMVYRFDPDGSGEVIAESARAGLEFVSRAALSGIGHSKPGAHPLSPQLAAHHPRYQCRARRRSSRSSIIWGSRSTCR